MSRSLSGGPAGSWPDLRLEVRGPGVLAGLKDGLREAVRSGRLAPGVRVPSSRVLAAELGVARNTVVAAYTELVAEGWLSSRPGSATRVAAAHGASPGGRPGVEPGPVEPAHDLRPGQPDVAAFPRAEWLRAARRVVGRVSGQQLGYADVRGAPELRAALAAYLARVRGVRADPERIVVCAGATHGLRLVAEALRSRGTRSVFTEAYGLDVHRRLLEEAGLRTRCLPVDGAGARTDLLAESRGTSGGWTDLVTDGSDVPGARTGLLAEGSGVPGGPTDLLTDGPGMPGARSDLLTDGPGMPGARSDLPTDGSDVPGARTGLLAEGPGVPGGPTGLLTEPRDAPGAWASLPADSRGASAGRANVPAGAGGAPGRRTDLRAGAHGTRGKPDTDTGSVLLTPAHQFPSGEVLSGERRTAVIRWARATGAVIVEDDYDGEFRYDSPPVGSLQALDPEHVAYLGTASKALAPGVRLGWLVVPDVLTGELRRALGEVGMCGALEQLVLAELLESGAYDRHVRAMRVRYRRRRDQLAAMLAGRPGSRLSGASAGLHAVVDLPPGHEAAVVAAAREIGLELCGISRFRHPCGPDDRDALVVGYATPSDAAWAGALAALETVLP